MPTWRIQAGAAIAAAPSNNEFLHSLGGLTDTGATEAHYQVRVRGTYTWANLYVRVIANGGGGNSELISRVNGGNGNQSVTIPAGTTGTFTDTTNSDSLTDGDLICVQAPTADVITVMAIAGTLYSPYTLPILVGNTTHDAIASGTTAYGPVGGDAASPTTTEADAQDQFKTTAVLSNFRVYVSANTSTGSRQLDLRVNGADGNQTVTVGAGLTGAFEDTSNSDSIAADDLVCYQVNAGTDGEITPVLFQVKADSDVRLTIAHKSDGLALNGVTPTTYSHTEGGSVKASTEAYVQTDALTAFTAKNAYIYISSNSMANPSTYTLRKDGGDTALTISVGGGLTGAFEDSEHTVEFSAGELLCWKNVVSGAGTVDLTAQSFEAQPPGPVGLSTVNDVPAGGISMVNDPVTWATIASINDVP